jgi:hypothetical protein
MYAVIRKYRFDPHDGEEVDRKVREVFVPRLKKAPGFVAYYWLDSGDGVGASLTVFRDREGAEESMRIAADFVQENLVGLATTMSSPEVTEGEVKAYA